jgi:hypothetical protein
MILNVVDHHGILLNAVQLLVLPIGTVVGVGVHMQLMFHRDVKLGIVIVVRKVQCHKNAVKLWILNIMMVPIVVIQHFGIHVVNSYPMVIQRILIGHQ